MSVKAYSGNEKYIFISYAHKDRDLVLPELSLLETYGCRFWYDEGIEAGDDWADRIGISLAGASAVLLFASDYAIKRENVLREIQYALDKKLPILVIKTGSRPFPEELQKELFTNQIVDIKSVSTYGELTKKLIPAFVKYGVMEEAGEAEDDAEASAIASQKIKSPDRSKMQKRIITIVGLVIGILLLVMLGRLLLFSSVPNVVGMQAEKAQELVTDAGMKSQLSLDYSPDHEYGVIFQQSADGTVLKYIPIVLTQSLGPNENLTTVPDVTGNHISDGAIALAACEMTKFTIHPETESSQQVEYISAQSIPPGLRISKDSRIQLDVKTNGEDISFYYNGKLITVSGMEDSELDLSLIKEQADSVESEATEEVSGLDLNRPDSFGMTEEEWKLFYANNHHTTDEDDKWKNVWLPAISEEMMTENPDRSYGWVAVRDMTLDADKLFRGYKELYVCPGVTVTVKGRVTDKDLRNDYYVAPGGTLIFTDEVSGGIYLANDGTTRFGRNLNGGRDGILIGNRGNIEVNRTIGKGVKLWNFFGASVTGEDTTGGTLHDYSQYRQVTATNWYEGCSGEKGLRILAGKMDIFAGYTALRESNSMEFGVTPVINPEDYEDHFQEEWYTMAYLFLNDSIVSRFREGRGCYWELIAAPGVTLTIDCPTGEVGKSLVAEEGSTLIVNHDIRPEYPYGVCFINDGTTIVNGNYAAKQGAQPSLVMNRGTFIANGMFGGSQMSIYNFVGSAISGNISEDTYFHNIDWRPEYVTYDNGPGGAQRYQEDVLAKVYGYRFWQDSEFWDNAG